MQPAQHHVQDWIHRLEVYKNARALKVLLLVLAGAAMALGYDLREFKNLSDGEAMDAAQLARNLATHQGYTTLLVRPFDLYLLQRVRPAAAAKPDNAPPASQIPDRQPDIANAPVYPLILAGLMKTIPAFKYQAAGLDPAWNRSGSFFMYRPDFLIALFNQALLVVVAVMVFFLAQRWFDAGVAWISTILFLGSDIFWRFSTSGLSTMLLIVIFLALAWCLALLEEGTQDEARNPRNSLFLAAVIGALAGLGGMTRYAFGWFIIPVMISLLISAGKHRAPLVLTVLAAFALVMTPWVVRNYQLTHTPFGSAGYAVIQGTAAFPKHTLERSLHPTLSLMNTRQLWHKLGVNGEAILTEELPRMGGTWVGAFFLAGLLVSFKSGTLGRLRGFIVLCLPVLIVAQALGRTQWTEDSPIINPENLLVLISPLIIIFGVSFFFTLLDQMTPMTQGLRSAVIAGFCGLLCLPTLLTFISARPTAISYPPYYPPVIQKTANWMKESELVMSDIPWAVAWYGQRQSIWLSLDAGGDFSNVDEHQKHVSAVYLTPLTMDGRFVSELARGGEQGWGSFVYGVISRGELPAGFPLKKMPTDFLPEQIFLTDKERWVQPAGE